MANHDNLTDAQRAAAASKAAGAAEANKLAQALGLSQSRLASLNETFRDNEEAMDGFTKRMGEATSATNIFGKLADTVFEESVKLLDQMDKSSSDLRKTFGLTFGSVLQKDLADTYENFKRLGATVADVKDAISDASRTISDFKFMNDASRKSIEANMVVMARLNVATTDQAEAYEYLTEVLGQSEKQANSTIRSFADVAEIAKIPVAELVSEFASMQGSFARYGDDAVLTFNRTAIAADRLGIQTRELLNISEGFDTFGGAAESVGTLNALLGGPFLNSVRMIQETDPVKRLEMIREAVFASGRTFGDMAEYEMKAFAEVIPGIGGDVSLLGKILSDMDSGLIQNSAQLQKAMGGAGSSVDDLAGRAENMMTLAEAFAAFKTNFQIDPQAVQGIANLATTTIQFFGLLGNALPTVIAGFTKFGTTMATSLKFISRFIPVVGTVVGLFSALFRLAQGDYVGAGAELAGAAMAAIPGAAAFKAIGGGLLASDILGQATVGQTGTMAATQALSQLPGMANGGIVTRPTVTRFAERGPELAVPLPPGVKDFNDLMASVGGTTNVKVTVGFDEFSMKPVVKNIVYGELAGAMVG